jgi:hypothetical protein
MRSAIAAMLAWTSLAASPSAAPQPPGEQFTELMGVRLLNVTLADVQARLGKADLAESGDAGEYLATICYLDPSTRTTVVFKSGEMGGPNHELLGFEVREYSHLTDAGCPPLPSGDGTPPSLGIGPLHLGMTQEAFGLALGGLRELTGRGIGRVFERTQPMTPEELVRCPPCADYPYSDIVIEVAGGFRADALVSVSVWKTLTH